MRATRQQTTAADRTTTRLIAAAVEFNIALALAHHSLVWCGNFADPPGGRLVQVTEHPGGTGYLNYQTSYNYDVLDDLTQVMQVQAAPFAATQTRTFAYDGLKRLTDATNPENGSVHYTYDDNGNLLSKLATPRNITTNFIYDALNRVVSKTYQGDTSGTPRVDYFYDAQPPPALPPGSPTFNRGQSIGRLIAVAYGGSNYGDSNTGTYEGYDQMGRVVQSIQVTQATTLQAYGFTYSYNLASEMLTEGYPTGRTITMAYDTAGRLSNVSGTKEGQQ